MNGHARSDSASDEPESPCQTTGASCALAGFRNPVDVKCLVRYIAVALRKTIVDLEAFTEAFDLEEGTDEDDSFCTVDHNEHRAQSVVMEHRPKRDIGPSQCPSFAGRRPRNTKPSDDDTESDRGLCQGGTSAKGETDETESESANAKHADTNHCHGYSSPCSATVEICPCMLRDENRNLRAAIDLIVYQQKILDASKINKPKQKTKSWVPGGGPAPFPMIHGSIHRFA